MPKVTLASSGGLADKERDMLYRGYHLEQKRMMVGWQVTVTKDDVFVRHSKVSKDLEAVMKEAHAYIDALDAQSTDLPTP